jgi:hypothetical protein
MLEALKSPQEEVTSMASLLFMYFEGSMRGLTSFCLSLLWRGKSLKTLWQQGHLQPSVLKYLMHLLQYFFPPE